MRKRDVKIDIFKGLLVVGMIYCHVLQFFCNTRINPSADVIINIVNVITFSGFVFGFGYTTRIAYLSRDFKDVYLRILNSAFKILVAFYISGIGFRVFVEGKPLNLQTAIKVLTLSDIPGWSEFLISFTLYILLAAILFKPFKALLEKKPLFWAIFGLLFLTTLIPYEMVNSPQLGLLIGTKRFAAFPVLQYMPFYLLGMYFQRYEIQFNLRLFSGAFILTGISIVDIVLNKGALPGRFPPTALWLFSAMLLLYLYYLLSKWMVKTGPISRFLQLTGQNTLIFLLLSNLTIFSLAGSNSMDPLNPLTGLAFAVLLVFASRYFIHIIFKPERSEARKG